MNAFIATLEELGAWKSELMVKRYAPSYCHAGHIWQAQSRLL